MRPFCTDEISDELPEIPTSKTLKPSMLTADTVEAAMSSAALRDRLMDGPPPVATVCRLCAESLLLNCFLYWAAVLSVPGDERLTVLVISLKQS